jgi:hypothetical protein
MGEWLACRADTGCLSAVIYLSVPSRRIAPLEWRLSRLNSRLDFIVRARAKMIPVMLVVDRPLQVCAYEAHSLRARGRVGR